MVSAFAVFEPPTLVLLQRYLQHEALVTSLIFTDRLSNRVLAGYVSTGSGSNAIVLNVRFKVDPEILAHTLVEEYVHAQQVLDGVDFETQRKQFPAYNERPYERDAKQTASDILGYTPEEYEIYLLREEPAGALYDRPGG